ncbi:MAG: glycosyltransferase [Candidatus Deferrimicrobiaceae bacterium]
MREGGRGTGARPVRVLYLIVDLAVGGAEDHLLSLARNLDWTRFLPVVCCIGRKGPIGAEIEAAGVQVEELGKLRKGGFDPEIVSLLRSLIRRDRIDLVHAHMYHANLYGRLAAFREGVPAVISVHNTYVRPKILRRVLNWWLARRTPFILAGSDAIRDDIVKYDGVPSGKIHVIPYGVDAEQFHCALSRGEAREKLGLPKERFIVGTVGRLEEQKGQINLIDAAGRLSREGREVTLLIVGSGREEDRLREQAIREGIGDAVLFLGTRRDLSELFRAMDVFAFPSLWEGFPIALLSAMAAGLPVIVTPVGGVPEVVKDGINGLIVPAGDPTALAAAIWRVHEDPVGASVLGGAAEATVRNRYSHRTTARRIMEIYEQVLGPRAGKGSRPGRAEGEES